MNKNNKNDMVKKVAKKIEFNVSKMSDVWLSLSLLGLLVSAACIISIVFGSGLSWVYPDAIVLSSGVVALAAALLKVFGW